MLLLGGCLVQERGDQKAPMADADTARAVKQELAVSTMGNIWHASGDLNKDGLADSAVVLQDTAADTWPYQLRIFFANPDKTFKEVLVSDTAIDAARPNGKDGYVTGDAFDQVTIRKGVLCLSVELLRGHYEHVFRYQHNRFELIGFSFGSSDGNGTISSSDFNLSTGHFINTRESYETDQLISKLDTVVLIRPLPDLAHFKPFDYHNGPVDF